MKKIIIISDSFKGTLSSKEISEIFKKECNKILPNVKVIPLCVADGGEGSLEAIVSSIKGRYINLKVSNPYFKKINSKFYISNKTAFIETASCAGLTLVLNKLNPELTTTYGLGEQIKKAIKLNCKKIYICLGGSATNDCGVGLAAALGTKFYDRNNKEFIPTGKTLNKICKINNSRTEKLLKGIKIIGLTDVTNPLYGKNGAAYIYAKQKGANNNMIKRLDKNLIYISNLISKQLKIDISNIKGSGSAGGLGAGIIAFLNGTLESGIESILKIIKFDKYLKNTNYVFTGEGKFDKQSLNGKVINGIYNHVKKYNIPLIIVAGSLDDNYKSIIKKYKLIENVYATTKTKMSMKELQKNAKKLYIRKIDEIFNNFKKLEK